MREVEGTRYESLPSEEPVEDVDNGVGETREAHAVLVTDISDSAQNVRAPPHYNTSSDALSRSRDEGILICRASLRGPFVSPLRFPLLVVVLREIKGMTQTTVSHSKQMGLIG
jgi:hypothetical protein